MKRAEILLPILLALLAAAPARASEALLVRGDAVVRVDDPALPAPVGEDCAAARTPAQAPIAASAAAGRTVSGTLDRFVQAGALSAADRDRYAEAYHHAQAVRGRLGGRPKAELAAVVRQLEAFVKRGVLTSTRVPPVFTQLERNTQYWQRGTIPVAKQPAVRPCTGKAGLGGARVIFDGDETVYQWYPGQGLQLQQLATFGRANALVNACRTDGPKVSIPCDKDRLRRALDGIEATAVDRGGFAAWEYYFAFGGGRPPWISGLAQGTAIQALTHGSQVLGEPRYLELAGRAVGAFRRAAPVGVRVRGARGPHFLIYSYAPSLRVFNAFFQALNGLYDYAEAADDDAARALFRSADREGRREARLVDTGAWSRYSLRGAESDLGYHRLVRDFLRGLCERTKASVYCATAERFTSYQARPARVRVTGAGRGGVRVWLSKISCVTLRAGGRPVLTRVLPRGTSTLPGVAKRPVVVDAKDLNGHHTVVRAGSKQIPGLPTTTPEPSFASATTWSPLRTVLHA